MLKIFKRANIEYRRVRWSSYKKTWKSFFVTLATLIFFTTLIGLFTWGMVSLFNGIKGTGG